MRRTFGVTQHYVDIMANPRRVTVTATIETAEARRARVLANADGTCEPWEYDLAVALGYEPESRDGFYRLRVAPFTVHEGYVIIREIVTKAPKPDAHPSVVSPAVIIGDRQSIRALLRPLPRGWADNR